MFCSGCHGFGRREVPSKDNSGANDTSPLTRQLSSPRNVGKTEDYRPTFKERLRKVFPAYRRKLATLDEFARLRAEGKFEQAVQLFTEDVVWTTLYKDKIVGRQDILKWMIEEAKSGRRTLDQDCWVEHPKKPDYYQRAMRVTFPSKATHEVTQHVVMSEDHKIASVVMTPTYPALGVALGFAEARAKQDDDAALSFMSEQVEWKAWDGFNVQGKDGVRKLFREMQGREVARMGRSEFEAATVDNCKGVFERILDIERVDGIKVKTTQQLFVKGELTELEPVDCGNGKTKPIWSMEPKIVEVRVLTTEELINGVWVKSQEDDHF